MLLIVGTESTWSLRALICSKIAGIEVKQHVIDLTASGYKSELLKYSQAGLVPALDNGSGVVHDSLAIAEYFNECTDGSLYPQSSSERALSRSLCAELHSGFINLRTQLPFTTDKVDPPSLLSDEVLKEVCRISEIFEKARLPFMFDSAGCVDAFYAVLAYRLKIYGITLEGQAGEYKKRLLEWDLFNQALERARIWKNI